MSEMLEVETGRQSDKAGDAGGGEADMGLPGEILKRDPTLKHLMLRLNDDISVEGHGLHRDRPGGRCAVLGSLGGEFGTQLLDVPDVDHSADDAGVDRIGADLGSGRVLKEAVAGCLPSAVVALHDARSLRSMVMVRTTLMAQG